MNRIYEKDKNYLLHPGETFTFDFSGESVAFFEAKGAKLRLSVRVYQLEDELNVKNGYAIVVGEK